MTQLGDVSLIRQETASDISIGKPNCCFQRLVGKPGSVVYLVLGAQAFQNLNCFFDGWRFDLYCLESPSCGDSASLSGGAKLGSNSFKISFRVRAGSTSRLFNTRAAISRSSPIFSSTLTATASPSLISPSNRCSVYHQRKKIEYCDE